MTTIIALSGKKKVGKNTVAKLIATLTPSSVSELAFADELKREVAKVCGVSVSYIDEHKDNFRLILQGWGTDFRRKLIDNNYWIHRFEEQLMKIKSDIVIVTDLRFINEYNYLNKLGAVLVRVARPFPAVKDEHSSETNLDGIDNWHHIILNTHTIDDLIPQVKELLVKCNIPIKNNK